MSKGEETYQKILDVSIYFFAKDGIHKTSFSKIADALKMTKPSLYYYVKSKEELVHKVFDYIFDDYSFDAYFEKEKLTQTTIEAYLIGGGHQFIEEIEEQNIILNLLNEFTLYAKRMEEKDETYMEKIKQSHQSFITGFAQILQQAEEFDLIKEEHIILRAQTMALMLDNIQSYHTLGLGMDSKELWSFTVRQVFV
ncbi:TetR/AcrR family transcriptional regulator [Kurthia sibirica]|nr:TetR/AcrR family transcriptional regulator [Kurthia sibirica]GEK33258.1 TetR family transcriptional regulator [Kurthia sibirica]